MLAEADEALRSDAAVCRACCARDGEALAIVAPAARSRDVVLAAVRASGAALRHVDDAKLLVDAEVVLAAAATWSRALEKASPRLLADVGFAKKACALDPWNLQYVDDVVAGDKAVVLEVSYLRGNWFLDARR